MCNIKIDAWCFNHTHYVLKSTVNLHNCVMTFASVHYLMNGYDSIIYSYDSASYHASHIILTDVDLIHGQFGLVVVDVLH